MHTCTGEEISPSDLLPRLKQGDSLRFAFRTPEEISALAGDLASICPSPDTAIVGLIELMANAIEHGVLQIGHQSKLHLRRNLSLEDEIQRRLSLPAYADLVAHVDVSLVQGHICYVISDPGVGFDWRPFENFCPTRAADPSGRGIAIAKSMGFELVEYLGCGNQVLAKVTMPKT